MNPLYNPRCNRDLPIPGPGCGRDRATCRYPECTYPERAEEAVVSRRERRPYPPGPIEMGPLPECGETNDVFRLRCSREPGHLGAHIHDDGDVVAAWGTELDPTRPAS